MPPLLTSDLVDPVPHKSPHKSPHRMAPFIQLPPPPKPPKPRVYPDGPLPLKPSDHAPRKATIKQRIALPDKVAYTLEIGGVEIEDVGIQEVLDYVSAYDLEQFEHRQFEEEGEIMRIARLEREAERERRKERAKNKGKVIYQSESEEDSDEDEDEEVETGKRGRARPTYKHLFKVPEMRQRRRRRKRHPVTGELMPLSDEEDAAFVAPSKAKVASPRPPAAPAAELPKRRRRKRDKRTGELLPLSPVAQQSDTVKKRPRRRRHPVTGELMPLGWRYDPNAEQQTYEDRRAGLAGTVTPSINRLSISREHDAKRVKLTPEEPSSDDELSTKQPASKYTRIMEISESDDLQNSSSQEPFAPTTRPNRTPKTSMPQLTPPSKSRLKPPSLAADSSSEPQITLASFLKSAKPNEDAESSSDESSIAEKKVITPGDRGKTSIMNPTAAQTSDESDDDEDEQLEDGEWFVEALLGHRLSDPRTHPGQKQAMLYKTKWEGWDEPTWEPEDSFDDRSVLDDYRRRAGLDRPSKTQKAPEPKKKTMVPPPKPKAPVVEESEEDDDEEEDDYEVDLS